MSYFILEAIWNKVKAWKEKCLSKVGKETLIKVVAQGIPNYIMYVATRFLRGVVITHNRVSTHKFLVGIV